MSSTAQSPQSQPGIVRLPLSLSQPLFEPDSESEEWENILRIKVELNSVSAQIFVEDSLVTWNLFVAKVTDLYRLPTNCEIAASYSTSDDNDATRVHIHTDAHLSALRTLNPIPRLSIHLLNNTDSPTLSSSITDTLPSKLSRIDSEPVSVASLLLDLEERVDSAQRGVENHGQIPDTVEADTMEFGGLNATLDERRAPVPALHLKQPSFLDESESVSKTPILESKDESVWRNSRRNKEQDDDEKKGPRGFEEVLFAVVIALFAWWMLR
ncbi:hypothetical protein BJ741DRAFT_618403 [Chytriomyces cf. hyalinus JEL632]|nr:hypothetical protein BJ741DRAFT_618403 [Chytriomyces cf. hyalinus JEL632]